MRYMRAALQQVRRLAVAGSRLKTGRVPFDNCLDFRFLRCWAPFLQACIALEDSEVPVGCVVVRDGRIAATGSNKTNEERNVRTGWAHLFHFPPWI